jgi:septum formation protein
LSAPLTGKCHIAWKSCPICRLWSLQNRATLLYPHVMASTSNPLIFLASASPRRSSLLTQIGISHEIRAVDIDEARNASESPAEYVYRLARTKAETLWNRLPTSSRLPVLGADTTVALGADVLGKPGSREELLSMLRRLSGTTHQVYTGVALCSERGTELRLSVSDVTFRPLTDLEILAYWDSGEPADKAGGYAVQGRAAVFIERINGSYSGIVGLPLLETAQLLQGIGWTAMQSDVIGMPARQTSGVGR